MKTHKDTDARCPESQVGYTGRTHPSWTYCGSFRLPSHLTPACAAPGQGQAQDFSPRMDFSSSVLFSHNLYSATSESRKIGETKSFQAGTAIGNCPKVETDFVLSWVAGNLVCLAHAMPLKNYTSLK